MPSPKRAPGGPIPFSIDPGQLPDDGSPVTFEQTFAKRLGPQNGTANPMSDEDYEILDWQLEYQLPNGKWAFLRKCKGRPYAHNMGEAEPGNYRATPIDRSGRLVDTQTKSFSIGGGNNLHTMTPAPAPMQMMPESRGHEESTSMPAWMQVLFQREAEERAEQRRRAEDDARRREAWEREQALKEEARREREERRAEMQAEREALARKEAADRTNALIMAGMQLAQQFVSKQNQPAHERRGDDRVQELLLQHVLRERSAPQSPQGGLKESLELLVALDQVAQSRADRLPPPQEEKSEDDMGSTMMKMLPMLIGGAAMSGGGASNASSPSPAPNVDAILGHALQNPQVIARIAAQNPEAVARTFSKVVKADKRIEDAVIKVLSEDDEGEDE